MMDATQQTDTPATTPAALQVDTADTLRADESGIGTLGIILIIIILLIVFGFIGFSFNS